MLHCHGMGLRDTLRQAKEAMSPDAIKQGLSAFGQPPSEEELAAARAAMTPEQQAAYDAQLAQVAVAQQQAQEAQQQAIAASEAHRVLDGPAGDHLYGPSAEAQMAALANTTLTGMLKSTAQQFGKELKDSYTGPPKHERDRELAAQIGAHERAARDAARAPYLAPERWPVHISRVATRGGSQVDEVLAFLRASGLGARPDLVYGLYRVPDRISPAVTAGSEVNRVVEWDVVHSALPDAPADVAVTAAWFPGGVQWVARRKGEPSVLDEDLGHLYLRRAGLLPEQTLGIARLCTFAQPKDRWFAIDGGGSSGEAGDSYPIVPIVEGALVFHPGPDASGLTAQLQAEAPLALGADVLAGTHTEVLNWKAIAEAVHVRVQHPPPTPSPFPYLPSTPQELLRAYLEIVGVRSFDCTSAQVTIDRPYSLIGRINMGTTNVGSAQPCADGKPRQRLHGARRVVVSYRDRPEYVAGRERWQRYQHEVLLAHLERATNVRAPVVPDELPDNPVLRAGARLLDLAEKVSTVGEWEPPPPYRYCWPVVG